MNQKDQKISKKAIKLTENKKTRKKTKKTEQKTR